ncbi:MAG: D-glycero-D-manno-heptose 1,7-bisphosphate phosphatase [Candidatus Parcubacteria bacterium]|jgi:D,D-heptose 1,7-bisphosphate phosphatase
MNEGTPEHKGAFLDRDGPVVIDTGYIDSPDRVELSPGATEGLQLLKKHGYKVVFISNQSGVGLGKFTAEQAASVHDRTIELLQQEGVEIDDAYYCLHSPDDECVCRKPHPTHVHAAAEKHKIDLSRSFFAGDRPTDLETGRNAHPNMKTVLVGDKEGKPLLPEDEHLADYKAPTLLEAAQWIIANGDAS